jgi:hypothetical protein
VLDPSTFKVNGGPSVAERINAELLKAKCAPFRPADNTRVAATQSKDRRGPMNGWDQMRARIAGEVDEQGQPTGRPMLYVFNTCSATLRTIPVLQHDPARAEDLDTESSDHCADDIRYGCSSRPWVKRVEKLKIPKDMAYRAPSERYTDDIQSSVKLS